MAARIKKGDTVAVISGKDKGKTGTVLRVIPEEMKVVVQGVNMVTKHQRPTQRAPEGKRFQKEAALYWSKVMPVDPARKAIGTKTAASTSPTPINAPVIWSMDLRVASSGESPSSCMMRSTFSTTTMASSTSKPMASTMANMVSMFTE